MHGDQGERHRARGESQHLLSGDSLELGDMSPQQTLEDKRPSQVVESYSVEQSNGENSGPRPSATSEEDVTPVNARRTEYRVYKMRWFGLAQLILLNIVVSWDVGTIHLQRLWSG